MNSQINFKKLLQAMQLIEDDRKIDQEVVISALKEAIAKAYRKHIDIPDVLVRVSINEKNGVIKAFHQKTVVNDVEDEELEISLADAREIDENIELGGVVDTEEVNISEFGRAAALLAKNVMKQKIREAEKQAVYDEYIDLLDEMVLGFVESVEEKFVVVNIGKTMALMPKSAQIPNEYYRDGQKIRVVITECNKETKGAQVLVSRADAKLVKRLFEKEVPEIYNGIVEIKAIARDAGERTKMAVYSKDENVDPIGACIGPRGGRVQSIIEELHGEKIDIFEWSDDMGDLIKNALSPANVLAVFYGDDKRSITVVVDDSQLSLAIGKKGKNARLAVKLCGTKIDIKTKSEIEEAGIDYEAKVLEFQAIQEKNRREKAHAKLVELEETNLVKDEEVLDESLVEDSSIMEEVKDETVAEIEIAVAETVEQAEEAVEDVVDELPVIDEITETKTEEVKVEEVKPVKKKKEIKPRTEYVSRFERLAEVPKPTVEKKSNKKKYKSEDDERRLRAKDIKKDKDWEIKPEYSEEELEEIRLQEELENSRWDEEVDYDDFEDYYDEEI